MIEAAQITKSKIELDVLIHLLVYHHLLHGVMVD